MSHLMSSLRFLIYLLPIAFLAQACGEKPSEQGASDETAAVSSEPSTDDMAATEETDAPPISANVVTIRAVGMTFEGPSKIASGWTTFQFENASDMVHFGIIDVPPEGVTMADFDILMSAFQGAMDGINAGDEAATNAAFGAFPAWVGNLKRAGGPGFLSPGHIGQTTIFLTPGHYVLECYVKSDGVFHTTPSEGQMGMMLPFEVTDEASGAPEPAANVTVSITNSGFAVTDGELKEGINTIRVTFDEQQAFPTFVGNDIHLIELTDEAALDTMAEWMNWMNPAGLEDPAPVTFLGGVNDMDAGATAYFTVDLAPGTYAFIAETPDFKASGHAMTFTIEAGATEDEAMETESTEPEPTE